jgi:hypothetical protein
LETESPAGIRFYTGRLFVTLLKTMDKKTVQRLIVSRQARPLPNDFCTVMDDMYFWGRSVSFKWYQNTLQLFRYYLWHGDDDFQTRMNMTTFLYHGVIRLRVIELLNMSFAGGNAAVYNAWTQHYNHLVDSGEKNFFTLSVSSFQFVSSKITRLRVQSQYHADSPVTVVLNAD